jgi:O-acetylserine/cysteine efflux transporter
MSNSIDSSRLSAAAFGAILLTTAIWGFNFIVIKVGVAGVPPLLLASLRFALSAFPAVLFIKKSAASWASLAAYGLFLGVGEFGLLFTAMKLGAPAGLSSIILQSQAFFTALIAAIVLKEKIRLHNVAGMGIAALGLTLIAVRGQGGSGGDLTPALAVMILLAAFFWAAANVVARKMPKTDGLSLMVWSSLFSPLPLLGLSLVFEGPLAVAAAFETLRPISIGALAYLVLLSTLFGYGAWNQLIMRYGAGRIAPFSLLVPIFGVSSGALVLGEHFTAMDALASVSVLAGLALHVLGGRLHGKKPS